jgi:FkbM family methyltransferase
MSKRILDMFGDKGFYVEAGAHDGIGDSQTWDLEQAGWSGLCVEPSSAFNGLALSRRCKKDCRALWDTNGVVLFRDVPGNSIELSGIEAVVPPDLAGESRYVQCVTLTTMLEQHGAPNTIEFLCLDVEGAEYSILAAHNFSKFVFLAIEVEYKTPQRRSYLERLLKLRGYRIADDDGTNLHLLHGSVK